MDTTDLEREIHDAACGLIADTGDRDLTLRVARAYLVVARGAVQVQAVCRATPDRGEVVLTRETDGSVSVLVERDGSERLKRGERMADVYAAAWAAMGERHD